MFTSTYSGILSRYLPYVGKEPFTGKRDNELDKEKRDKEANINGGIEVSQLRADLRC